MSGKYPYYNRTKNYTYKERIAIYDRMRRENEWVAACDLPDTRTDEQIREDALNGYF